MNRGGKRAARYKRSVREDRPLLPADELSRLVDKTGYHNGLPFNDVVEVREINLFGRRQHGLFVKNEPEYAGIEPGSTIAEIKGVRIPVDLADMMERMGMDCGYMVRVRGTNIVIDDNPKTCRNPMREMSLGSFANHYQGIGTQNAELETIGEKVFIRTTAFVPSGAQILVNYGDNYAWPQEVLNSWHPPAVIDLDPEIIEID